MKSLQKGIPSGTNMPNKWLNCAIPGVALTTCIGSVYWWSQFTKELMETFGISRMGTDIGFTLVIFFLGMCAALFGRTIERNPRAGAVISTVLVLIVLEATYFINLTIGRRQMTLSVTAPDKKTLEGLIDTLKADGVKIQSCEIESRSGEGGRKYIATFDISVRNEGYEDKILELTEGLDGSLVFNMK